jgi:hypothetical protein
MREGTVVRYLGWGSYSVFIDEDEVRSVDEGLLSLRQDDEGAEGQELRGLLVETTWQASASETRSLVESRRIRWYNPKLESFEWRESPKSNEEALALLDEHPGCERYVEVYEEWRALGASVVAALIRAGEAAEMAGGGE